MGTQGAEIAVPVTNTYEYDKVGNRTAAIQTDESGYVMESRKSTSVSYTYDADRNLAA